MQKDSESTPPYIHHPKDGRGLRKVFLDGEEIMKVIYVNEMTGDVTFYTNPLQVDFSGDVFCCTRRGHVRIEYFGFTG